jgi:hypothetical protein
MTIRCAVFAGALALCALAQAQTPAPRIEVAISAAEREVVLDRMRTMLAQSQAILDAALKDDRPRLAQAARTVGLTGEAHMPPEVVSRLPAAFKQLAQQTHRSFDAIAEAAERAEPRDALLARLSENLGRCVACHSAYRLAEPR